jgi:hypothetical protein
MSAVNLSADDLTQVRSIVHSLGCLTSSDWIFNLGVLLVPIS